LNTPKITNISDLSHDYGLLKELAERGELEEPKKNRNDFYITAVSFLTSDVIKTLQKRVKKRE